MPLWFVGQEFSSFEESKEQLEAFKKRNYVDLYKRDSISIAAAEKRLNKSEYLRFMS